MVAISYQKLTRLLELYLLKQAQGRLPTSSYALMALMPVDSNAWLDRQTLFVSSSTLADKSRRSVTHDLFVLLKQGLSEEQYLEIYNIDLLDTNSYPVQRLNAWEPQRTDNILSVPISVIGGVSSQTMTVIRSSVLENLSYHTSLQIRVTNGASFRGKLLSIQQTDTDAKLDFETDTGPHSCLFTDIVRVNL